MPTVPRVQRQIAPTALPAARLTAALTPAAAGVNVHEARANQALQEGQASARTWGAVSNLAETGFKHTVAWGQIIAQEKERADQVAVMEAENQLLLRMNKLEVDALAQRGKNALGVPEATLAQYNETANEIAGTLTTPRQKWAFNRVKGNRGAQLDMTLRRHTLREMQAYEADELKSSVKLNVNAAIDAYNDEATRDYNLATAITNIRQSGPRLGKSEAEIDANVLDVTSAAHVGIINQYLSDDNPDAAKAYFAKVVKQGEIAGEYQDDIREQLNKGTDRKKAQEEFDRIIGTLPQDQWVKAARGLKDPEVRDDVENRVDHQINVNKTVEREQHEATVTEGKNIVEKSGNYLSIPFQLREKFTVGEAGALRNYAESLTARTAIKTDQGVRSWLHSLATSDDAGQRLQFTHLNLLQYVDKLSPADLEQYQNIQATVRKGDLAAAHAMQVNDTVQKQVVDGALIRMGFDPTPPPPGTKAFDAPQAQAVSLFREKVRLQVDAIQASTGKTATDEQVRSIVNELSTATVQAVPDTWFPNFLFGFGEDPRPASGFKYETSKNPRTIGEVPSAWRADFVTKFQKRYPRPPLDREILAAYNQVVPQ